MLDSATDAVLWSITQIEDPQLSVTTDTKEAVDALGAPITTYERAKTAEFSASNTLFDLGLLAAQSGTAKVNSTASVRIPVPVFKTVIVPATGTTATLDFAPNADGIPFIYKLNGDDTLGDKVPYASTASANAFSFAGTTLTFPTGSTAGDRYMAIYERDADATNEAVSVTGTGVDFPKAGKFVMEVIGNDVCNPSTTVYAYVIFPNAKLLSSFDVTFGTDSKHPFKLKAMTNYCDPAKKLFQIIIPE